MRHVSHPHNRRHLKTVLLLVACSLVLVGSGCTGSHGTATDGSRHLDTEPIYIATHVVARDSTGMNGYLDDKTLDAHGGTLTSCINYWVPELNDYMHPFSTSFALDDFGMPISSSEDFDGGTIETSFKNQYDELGRIVHARVRSGGNAYEIEYQYYDEGSISTIIEHEGLPVTREVVSEYDENGYILSRKETSEHVKQVDTYDWKMDKEGNPTEYTETTTVEGLADRVVHYRCVTDSNGNITELRADNDAHVIEFEYTLVEDPYPAVMCLNVTEYQW